jgi:hypothetical protein
MEYAREAGLAYVSLGNDPALFGHVVQPGLFDFKTRMGFTPVPSEVLDPSLAGEFADRVLSLRSLADPSLFVTWGRYRGNPPTWPDAVRGGAQDLLIVSDDPQPAPASAAASQFGACSTPRAGPRPSRTTDFGVGGRRSVATWL